MKKPEGYCKGCKDRTEDCHATCEKYQEYRKELDEYNEIVKREHTKQYGPMFCNIRGKIMTAKERRNKTGKYQRRRKK